MCDWMLELCEFFFFNQKTAYELRMSDWSSDVCSSDLEFLGLPHGVFAVMENAGRQDGIGAPRGDAIGQVLKVAHPARGDHRNGDSVGYRPRQFKVEARLGAVAVPAGTQQFAGAVIGHFFGPLYRRSEELGVGKECVKTL